MALRTGAVNQFLLNSDAYVSIPRSYKQGHEADHSDAQAAQADGIGCGIRQLPERLLFAAAEVAARINPVNAPAFGQSAVVAEGVLPTPLAAAVATAKYWGPQPRKLTVSFIGSTPTDLRRKIVSHLNAWTQTGCIEFVETQGIGQIRIARGSGGYWSYLGTDVLLIPQNRPTMNLQGFSMNTPDSEFTRVVRHEAGHTLGLPHEHMREELVRRIDPAKAYEYFRRTQGWDRATVDQQVLTPLDQATIIGSPPDQDSIMCYRLPGSITVDGQPIRGGHDINASDYAFVGSIYPKPLQPPQTIENAAGPWRVGSDSDWPESDDVREIAFGD